MRNVYLIHSVYPQNSCLDTGKASSTGNLIGSLAYVCQNGTEAPPLGGLSGTSGLAKRAFVSTSLTDGLMSSVTSSCQYRFDISCLMNIFEVCRQVQFNDGCDEAYGYGIGLTDAGRKFLNVHAYCPQKKIIVSMSAKSECENAILALCNAALSNYNADDCNYVKTMINFIYSNEVTDGSNPVQTFTGNMKKRQDIYSLIRLG